MPDRFVGQGDALALEAVGAVYPKWLTILLRTSSTIRPHRYREADPLTKQDAVRRAYLELRDLIVHGALAPGSPLIERTVAEVVDASRSTVRNALHQLAHEGFVTVSSIGERYSRFLVGPLAIEDMREWYHMFGALDGIAARGAAELPVQDRLVIADTARTLAEAHYDAGSGSAPHYERIQDLDSRFHGTYVNAGAGALLLREHASLRPHVERYGIFYATALITELPSDVLKEHNAIADAIEAGDADAAERAAVMNWRNATVRFAAVMREAGERGNWQAIGARRRSGPGGQPMVAN